MLRAVISCLIVFSVSGLNAEGLDNLLLGTPGKCDVIINRRGYALGYSTKYKQSLWVIYRITKAEMDAPRFKRTNDFRVDPLIKTGTAVLTDYRKSGYDRGHLAPASTMGFSKQTTSESFYLSNMRVHRSQSSTVAYGKGSNLK